MTLDDFLVYLPGALFVLVGIGFWAFHGIYERGFRAGLDAGLSQCCGKCWREQ